VKYSGVALFGDVKNTAVTTWMLNIQLWQCGDMKYLALQYSCVKYSAVVIWIYEYSAAAIRICEIFSCDNMFM
jgi:hypothetical protein